MRDSMLGKILTLVVTAPEEVLGALTDLLEKLIFGHDKREFLTEFRKFLRKEECWVTKKAGKVVANLIRFVGEREFPCVTRFVARDSFVVGTRVSARVKISNLGYNFRVWFLDKTEINVPVSTLVYGDLSNDSLDDPIIQSLGGEEKVETSLAEVFHLMSLQPAGEEGALLTNGWANIFYIRGVDRVLRVVRVRWCRWSWEVDTYSTSDPDEWRTGFRVFSHKQVLVSK